jgi:hypothetical protein
VVSSANRTPTGDDTRTRTTRIFHLFPEILNLRHAAHDKLLKNLPFQPLAPDLDLAALQIVVQHQCHDRGACAVRALHVRLVGIPVRDRPKQATERAGGELEAVFVGYLSALRGEDEIDLGGPGMPSGSRDLLAGWSVDGDFGTGGSNQWAVVVNEVERSVGADWGK